MATHQQHDLRTASVGRILTATGVRPGTSVLELGAGLGALTGALLSKGLTVHASEIDAERVAALRQRFAKALLEERLTLHEGDGLAWRPAMAEGWRAIANPPFQITAAFIRALLFGTWPGGPPDAMDLVLQRETAHKCCGQPRSQSRTSVILQLAGAPGIALDLSREDVQPVSRVDLCLWSWRRRRSSPGTPELRRIDSLLETAFAGPHSLRDALRGLATMTQLRRQGQLHGYDPEAHPRVLVPAAWRDLAALLHTCGRL